MSHGLTLARLPRVLFAPRAVFEDLRERRPSPSRVFWGFALWLCALPPLFAWFGTSRHGWQLGAEPLELSRYDTTMVSLAYFAALVFGFLSTAMITRWMARTYNASESTGRCFALVAIIGAPLAVASVVHLWPYAFINVLVLVPALIWSMYLLYRGLPVVLKTGPNRGMLMASALIAFLLVAWVSLLGIMVVLWGWGLGPRVGT